VDLNRLGEHTIKIDCDVIQADGGTRTASITGAFVALMDALRFMIDSDMISEIPLNGYVAAVSVGMVQGECLLDLCYLEDSTADVDMNIVMLDDQFVEMQGTAEGATFDRGNLDAMTDIAVKGIKNLVEKQKEALGSS
jgi:ribonuclease PH